MKKKLLIIIPIVVILAAAAAALVLLLPGEQQEAEIEYNEDAFGEYFIKHLFPMGHYTTCPHRLVYYSTGKDIHRQICVFSAEDPWGCDFETVYSPHEYEFQSVAGGTCDDYGYVYHFVNVKCSVCGEKQYRPLFKCKLNSPACDGSCLGFSVGDHVEVDE